MIKEENTSILCQEHLSLHVNYRDLFQLFSKERHNITIRNSVSFRNPNWEIQNKFHFHKLTMFLKTVENHTLRWDQFSF